FDKGDRRIGCDEGGVAVQVPAPANEAKAAGDAEAETPPTEETVKSETHSSPYFQNEQEAQKRCPQDVVVWLNLRSGVYHFKGQRWYANTNNGAFVCRDEAEKAGDRATANGQ